MRNFKAAFVGFALVVIVSHELSDAYQSKPETMHRIELSSLDKFINNSDTSRVATGAAILPVLVDLTCAVCEKLKTQTKRDECQKKYCQVADGQSMAAGPGDGGSQMRSKFQDDFKQEMTRNIQKRIDNLGENEMSVVISELANVLCKACETLTNPKERANCERKHCIEREKTTKNTFTSTVMSKPKLNLGRQLNTMSKKSMIMPTVLNLKRKQDSIKRKHLEQKQRGPSITGSVLEGKTDLRDRKTLAEIKRTSTKPSYRNKSLGSNKMTKKPRRLPFALLS